MNTIQTKEKVHGLVLVFPIGHACTRLEQICTSNKKRRGDSILRFENEAFHDKSFPSYVFVGVAIRVMLKIDSPKKEKDLSFYVDKQFVKTSS